MESAGISSIPTFYRAASRLIENELVKRVNGDYALKNYTSTRMRIREAFTRLLDGSQNFATPTSLSIAVKKPWPEIESQAYELAEEMGLTVKPLWGDEIRFYKAPQPSKQ
jgi:hypothetical protein